MALNKYKIEFPLFGKIDVNGENAHEVYQFLRKNSSLYDREKNTAEGIPWNFSKFLVNEHGKVIKYFTPTDDFKEIEIEILKLLANIC